MRGTGIWITIFIMICGLIWRTLHCDAPQTYVGRIRISQRLICRGLTRGLHTVTPNIMWVAVILIF